MKNEIEQQIFEKMKAKDFGESMCNETKLNVLKWTMQQLRKHDVSGALLVEIKTLLEQYRDEEMPDWNAPFHYDAEGWSAMKYFIQWLEHKSNDR